MAVVGRAEGQKCGNKGHCTLLAGEALLWVLRLQEAPSTWDIVFMPPPPDFPHTLCKVGSEENF